jgi:cytochrome P450
LEEIKEFRLQPLSSIKQNLTKDKLNELTYLYQVIKEALRIDPPANETLPYICVKDFEMLGVRIKKGQLISANILSRHYNVDQWRDGRKFIPERFDPESEHFLDAKSQKRHPLSWIPFSINLRI